MRNALPVSQARFSNSSDRIIGAGGEINATGNRDLVLKLVEIANRISQGELAPTEELALRSNTVAEIAARREAVREAYYDRNGSSWAEMASAISNEIETRVIREGFMRDIFAPGNVEEGSVPRMRIREKNVKAVLSNGPVQVYPQYVRDSYQELPEFYVSATPSVEELELVRGSGDILQDKYEEGLEAIWVQEDRTALKLLKTADGIYNPVTYFTGALTPSVYQTVKYNVESYRIPVSRALISMDLMNDLAVGNGFGSWFEPVAKWEINQTGRIGTVLGVNLVTDGFREPNLRVLNDGEFYILGTPEYLGGYTTRGPIESRAVDEFDKFVPARGWRMWEILGMGLGNAKAVARAQRQG